MTTMRCEAVRDALPALARGTLGTAEAAQVRAHLAGCDECADAWTVVDALAHAHVTAPKGLADRVSAEVARRRGSRSTGASRPVRWLAGGGLAAAAVIALLLAWPNRDEVSSDRTIELATVAAVADPFLDEELFGATTPTEAELDGMIRVAATDTASLPQAIVAEEMTGVPDEVPALAMDVGSPLGDWPGVDGMSAGVMTMDDLSYEEMQLLLTEMES